MWEHHEKYREAKIELESLIQELQQELEKLKATCIINTEKIGYTYQVKRWAIHALASIMIPTIILHYIILGSKKTRRGECLCKIPTKTEA